ncbi:MAG TPA: efflux RND transporter permease subunit, partial [Thermoanaerobaculia bacterium]
MRLLGFLRERRAALVLTIALLALAGLEIARRLPASIFPSVTFPVIKVIADAGEEPAARLMPTVTRPLEEALLRVPGIRVVRSTTSRGSTEISANFTWGTDMQVALQRVQGEVGRIRTDLPSEAKVDIEWMNTAIFPILGYALTSDTRSQAALWELAEYKLKPELIRIPGVSQVQIQGGRRREFQVRLDPRALAARKLGPADVVNAIRKNNQVLSAGLTEANHELYLSLVDGRVGGLDALGEIDVPIPGGGVPADLKDLGTIAPADAVSYIRTTADGRPAVLVNIIRQPDANTVEIARDVDALFRDHPTLIPSDTRWATFYDQADFVSRSVNGVRDAILIGVGLAALILLAFLRDLKLTLIAVAAIPLCVALLLLALGVFGQTINLMTLGGIAAAIGLIADDAIVVVENIHRHREAGAPDPVRSGLFELMPALMGSTSSTIVIFLPFALLTGVTGAFFKPLALTMALALAISFFLAALVIPMLSRASGNTRAPRESGHSRFRAVVSLFLRRSSLAAAVPLLLLVGACLLFRSIGTDFLPAMDEGSIILDYWTPPGTSLTDTDAMLGGAEKIIMALPDLQSYSRRTGTQLGFFITEPNRGDYVIRLKPRRQRRPIDEVMDEIRTRLAAAQPAIHTDFGQLIEDNIGDLTGGVPQPIDLKIFGEDQTLLQQKARQAAEILGKVKGVEDVFDGIVIAGPALQIRLAPSETAAAGSSNEPARFGLTTEEVHDAVEPAVAGTVASNILIGERLYDVRVFARSESGLRDLLIRTPSGTLLPLTTIASITTGPPEAEIDRENLKT